MIWACYPFICVLYCELGSFIDRSSAEPLLYPVFSLSKSVYLCKMTYLHENHIRLLPLIKNNSHRLQDSITYSHVILYQQQQQKQIPEISHFRYINFVLTITQSLFIFISTVDKDKWLIFDNLISYIDWICFSLC